MKYIVYVALILGIFQQVISSSLNDSECTGPKYPSIKLEDILLPNIHPCNAIVNNGTGSIGPITKEEYDSACGEMKWPEKVKWAIFELAVGFMHSMGDNFIHAVAQFMLKIDELKQKFKQKQTHSTNC